MATCHTVGTWVGFEGGHPVGTFWVLNPIIWQINLTHHVTLLNETQSKWNDVDDPAITLVSYEGLDDEEDESVSKKKIIIIMIINVYYC